jgi:pre-mRNA-processing factor 40
LNHLSPAFPSLSPASPKVALIALASKMNGAMNGHSAPPSLWQKARNADGRVYYYNTVTKATQWTKPEDLMTPAEVRC